MKTESLEVTLKAGPFDLMLGVQYSHLQLKKERNVLFNGYRYGPSPVPLSGTRKK